MRKWWIGNTESLEVMTQPYALLFVPPGYPFTSTPTNIENRLKREGVVPDAETFDRVGRDDLLENLPALLFNARYDKK